MTDSARTWVLHAALCGGFLLAGAWAWGRAAFIAHHGTPLSGDAFLMLAAAVLALACAAHVVASTALLAWRMRTPHAGSLRSAHGFALLTDVGLLVASPALLRLAAAMGFLH